MSREHVLPILSQIKAELDRGREAVAKVEEVCIPGFIWIKTCTNKFSYTLLCQMLTRIRAKPGYLPQNPLVVTKARIMIPAVYTKSSFRQRMLRFKKLSKRSPNSRQQQPKPKNAVIEPKRRHERRARTLLPPRGRFSPIIIKCSPSSAGIRNSRWNFAPPWKI